MAGRKPTNPAREYFLFDPQQKKSTCLLTSCGTVISGNNSTNLERHVARSHPQEYASITRKKIDASKNQTQALSTQNPKCSYRRILISEAIVLDACVELVTCNGRPFTLMEDSGFQKLLRPIVECLGGGFAINAQNIRSSVKEKAAMIREEIEKEVAGRIICVKVDTATRMGRSFLGVNIQFIKEGRVMLRTLAVKEVFDRHTSENLKEEIMSILSGYGIGLKYIYCITTDNAANMLKAAELMAVTLPDSELDDLTEDETIPDECSDDENDLTDSPPISEDGYTSSTEEDNFPATTLDFSYEGDSNFSLQSIRCAAHTLQLAVQDGLKSKETKVLLNKARNYCKALRVPTMAATLKRLKVSKPPLDCPTRWHSTHDMLAAIVAQQALCEELMSPSRNKKTSNMISPSEWAELADLVRVLQPAKIATKRLQEEQLLMGDFYRIWLQCKYDTMKQAHSRVADLIVKSMTRREEQLLTSKALAAALLCDPRYNLVMSVEDVAKAKGHLKSLWRRISPQSTPEVPVESLSLDTDTPMADDIERYLRSLETDMANVQKEQADDIGTVLDGLRSVRIPKEADILQYWEMKKISDPELYKLATIALSVPATQVSVERLFSGLRFILSYLRYNLSPDLLDDIITIRANRK